MFIVTTLYKKLPINILGLNQDVDLTNSERMGFFPVFETEEQANKFAKDVLIKTGVEINIIEFSQNQ